jgi:hypothetical protein
MNKPLTIRRVGNSLSLTSRYRRVWASAKRKSMPCARLGLRLPYDADFDKAVKRPVAHAQISERDEETAE